jgi:hypothetical protein
MRPKFLEKTDKSELQSGKRRQCSKGNKKRRMEKIPEELEEKDAFKGAGTKSEPSLELEDTMDQQKL